MQRTVWRQWQFCTFQSPQGLSNQGHNHLREEHDLFTGRQEVRGEEKEREQQEKERSLMKRRTETTGNEIEKEEVR